MTKLAYLLAVLVLTVEASIGAEIRFPVATHNLLLEASFSGNLESYGKGLRGKPDHMVYDNEAQRFVEASQHHEYGVGFQQDLGVISEAGPAFWLAEWKKPVLANCIVLSGVYPNQPQPKTGWKIEIRREGRWFIHARGTGGWYDRGRYVWGGAGTRPIEFDALRVSVFSRDTATPIKSIHFRGEEGCSWVVANLPPIDARIRLRRRRVRGGTPVQLTGERLAGEITSWTWDLGDGTEKRGRSVEHVFSTPGTVRVTLRISDGTHRAQVRQTVQVTSPVEARITPFTGPAMAGRPVLFMSSESLGPITSRSWDFGDGRSAHGEVVPYVFTSPGIYKVTLTVSGGQYKDEGIAIIRVHTPATVSVPQVFLDTDQKNEVDDQHYLAYAVFGDLEVLGVNSIHHGGGQEPINYGEILNILNLAEESGLPDSRQPLVFRGANERLAVPESLTWSDTEPIVTPASEAILAAARGASPSNPVWILPVGPGTNMASAILQAREEGLELNGRLRVMWLGGSNEGITREFNGNNDPWSMVVVGQSGLETWIIPAPVGGRIKMDKRREGNLYPDNPLGRYLREITPNHAKSLYDPSCVCAVISMKLGLGWVKEVEPVSIRGPREDYRWSRAEASSPVRVIRQIDQEAMKQDIFATLKGTPRRIRGG